MSIDVLSLACNIMTVIDSGQKFYQTVRDVYENGKPDTSAQSKATELLRLTERLAASQEKARQSNSVPEDGQLFNVAKKCSEAATKLHDKIEKLAPSESSSRVGKLLRSFGAAVKRNWRHGRIEQLNESLEGCQAIMQSTILVEIYTSGEAERVTNLENFARLEAILQNFALAVSKQELQMSQLLDSRSLHQETQAMVHNEVAALRQAQILDADFARLKKSLKFPGLNQRFNGVVKGHEKSFQWLLGNTMKSDAGDREHDKDKVNSAQEPEYIRESRSETFSDFRQWLISEPSSKLYWISGKPGAGKSTLMKSLYEDMRDINDNNAPEESRLVIHHFFWLGSSRRSRQNDIQGMYMSLLHQLLDIEVQDGISLATMLLQQAPYVRRMDSDDDWSLEHLKRTMLLALENLGNRYSIYILLDALDEHLPTAQHDQLLSAIGELQGMTNVRLVVSSRRERIFEHRLAGSRQLRLHKLTTPDIYYYALDSLQGYVDRAFPDSQDDSATKFLHETVETIVRKAEGVFLWARLAVESIKGGLIDDNTLSELRERLEDMPTELSEYFKSIWKRLGDNEKRYQTKAANVFLFLLSHDAFERSFLQEGDFDCLSLSLALTPDTARALILGDDHISNAFLLEMAQRTEKMVLSHCAGLVELTLDWAEESLDKCGSLRAQVMSARRECRFIHRTARDFFVDTSEGQDILNSNDLGGDGPDFQLVQAFLARSVAFRTSEHAGVLSLAMRNVDMRLFFESLVSSSFTKQQRYSLIELCHKVFYQVSGHPDNPLFQGWTVVEPFNHIRPFISEAAYRGHSGYAAQWMKDQANGGRIFSPEYCDMVLKESVLGRYHFSATTNSLSFATLLSFDPMFGSADKLNIRLPLACFGRHGADAADLAGSRNLYSTSQMILAFVLFAYDHVSHTELLADLIIEPLKSLSTPNERLLEKVLCICSYPMDTAAVQLHFPLMVTGSSERPGSAGRWTKGVHLVFETSPLWVVQLLTKMIVRREEPNPWSRELEKFVRLHSQSGRRLQKPQPVLLFESTDIMPSGSLFNTKIPLPTELKRVPPEASRDLSEMLGMLYEDDREDVRGALYDRAWEAWTDSSTERIGTDRVEEVLEDHGILCSKEEKERLVAMCNINEWHKDAITSEEAKGRFVVPPKGASPEQEALSHVTMKFETTLR